MKRGDEGGSVPDPGLSFSTSVAAAEFMASIYKDLVALQDEVIFEVEDVLPGYSLEIQQRICADIEMVRAERDRLRRCLQRWEEQQIVT